MFAGSSLRRLLSIQSYAFLLLVLVSTAAGGGVIYLHHDVARRSASLGDMLDLIQVLRGDLYRQVKELYDYVFLGDPDALVEFESFARDVEQRLSELRALPGAGRFEAQIGQLEQTYREVMGRARVIMNQNQADFTPEQLFEVFEIGLEQGEMLQYERAFAAAEALVAAAQEDLRRYAQRVELLAGFVLLVPLVIGALLLLFSRRLFQGQVAEPAQGLIQAAERLRRGDLESRVEEGGAAEFLALQRSFNAMARDLDRSRNALVQAEKQASLGALVPILAHNIRNPLASIRATAQVMDEPGMAEDQKLALDGIVDSVDRLESWLSRLLVFLHPAQPLQGEFSLASAVDNALGLLRHRLEEKGVEAKTDYPERSDLRGDRSLLEQAVFGLLTNALEASPRGQAIEVAVAREGSGGWRIAILDRGPGMPFGERRTDADGELGFGPTTKPGGSGLGVPFARKVCEMHGGRLEFQPRKGGGTVTTMHLMEG